jgi:hypothetical protein
MRDWILRDQRIFSFTPTMGGYHAFFPNPPDRMQGGQGAQGIRHG